MKNRILVAIAVTLAIGCGSGEYLPESFVPKEADRFARDYIELIRTKRYTEARDLLDARIRTPDSLDTLRILGDWLDKGVPLSIHTVGASTSIGTDQRRYDLSYEIHLTNEWILASVVILKTGGNLSVYGIHLNPLPSSLETLNAFTLRGKTTRHYVVLGLMAVAGVLTLIAFVVAVRTKLRRKWLWLLFILVGVGHISINWTTGQISIQPIYFVFCSIGAFRPLYGAWLLHVAFPLGAVMFLVRRKQVQLKQPEERSESNQSDAHPPI